MADQNIAQVAAALARLPLGPMAVIVNEDGVELASTVAHHRRLGFGAVLVLGEENAGPDLPCEVVKWTVGESLGKTVNPLLSLLENRWVLFVYNAEYFFFPFCEDRMAADVTQFVAEENRDAIHAVTVDLYAQDLDGAGKAVSRDDAHFDDAGYYAQDRYDGPQALERQKEIFGGLKWRFSEHIPWARQRINRIAFFRVPAGAQFGSGDWLDVAELDTLECPWHRSLTGAVASFRVAKSLVNNPGSTFEIDTFMWERSRRFEWSSAQLMTLGFMEPGQWF